MQHGNYIVTTAKPTIVSALGAIPKPDSDNIRLIHDCSRPQHSNVNSYSDTKQHYSYVTVDKAVSLIKSNAYLAKIDLKSAYRHVPIHPSNYTATGLAWHFRGDSTLTYLYDCKLPFGAAKSPEIFHRLTQAITRMMERRGFTVLAYLDDFLIISDTAQECKQAYQELIKLLGELGFQINWNKAVGPCQRLTFLGIEIDTVRRQLTLPERILCELRLLLSETTAKRSITKRELQSLVGKLNFAARVVFGGRTFLRRMIDTVNHMRRPHHHARIKSQMRADLEWWTEFLSVFNGKTFFVDSEPVSTEEFSTDACPIGGGGFFRGDWFYVNWAIDYPSMANIHINLQETFTVLVALERWKDDLRDKWITVRTDNTTTLSAINKGTSGNQLAMQWLRKIFWLSATYNFRVTARYIPTASNTIADAISRLHDPTHCEVFVKKLVNLPLAIRPQVTPHLSHNAFVALPSLVQYRLRNSNLMSS
ncbi:hypothetical protein ACROYT_G012757 [Oculina patagonica]